MQPGALFVDDSLCLLPPKVILPVRRGATQPQVSRRSERHRTVGSGRRAQDIRSGAARAAPMSGMAIDVVQKLAHAPRMGELEQRLAAVETLLLAIGPWIDRDVMDDAAATLRVEMQTAEGEERAVVAGALQLLTDGRDRFRPPAVGLFVRGR